MNRMSESNYYLNQKEKMVRNFGKILKLLKGIIENSDKLYDNFILEYKKLIPQIPYVGGRKNPLTQNLISTTWWLAIYKVLKEEGRSVEEIADFTDMVLKKYVEKIPKFFLKIIGKLRISRKAILRWKKYADWLQKKDYKDNWNGVFVEGDGKNVIYGFDYTECAIEKFYRQMGAGEFIPYVCKNDFVIYSAMGINLKRDETLADGNKRCNFRFLKTKL